MGAEKLPFSRELAQSWLGTTNHHGCSACTLHMSEPRSIHSNGQTCESNLTLSESWTMSVRERAVTVSERALLEFFRRRTKVLPSIIREQRIAARQKCQQASARVRGTPHARTREWSSVKTENKGTRRSGAMVLWKRRERGAARTAVPFGSRSMDHASGPPC